MKITKQQLRRIIRESILSEIVPPGHEVPRSVQADFDLANKEDTFPKRKPTKPGSPDPQEKQVYEKIVADVTRTLKGLPGFESHMAGQAATVQLPVGEVAELLSPQLKSLGAEVTDGKSGEGSVAVTHPNSPDIRMYIYQMTGTLAPKETTTEIDFGIPPGGYK